MSDKAVVWLIALGCALVGLLIGRRKGNAFTGFLWGLIMGPIGWVIMVTTRKHSSKCPNCGGIVDKGYEQCKHCGSDLNLENCA